MTKAVVTQAAPQAIGPYSQGVLVGDLLFVSGQLPIDPTTAQMPDGIADQARRSLAYVVAVLESAGFASADVTITQGHVMSLAYLDRIGDVGAFVSHEHILGLLAYTSRRSQAVVLEDLV